MNLRRLGKTGLMVSEIGFGGEWLERHSEEEGEAIMRYAAERGVNIVDCWMPDPKSRDIIGRAMAGNRAHWKVQGHLGSVWKNGQYARTRVLSEVRPAFEDILTRMRTDYIDLGMIHFVDSADEWHKIQESDYLRYLLELKKQGVVKHIGMSTHNPETALLAARTDYIEMILFSVNPAFDMLPPSEDINSLFAERFDESLSGIDPARARLYSECEQRDVGITVMKGFAGGRLLDAKRSPFGVALTPVQCIHYALTRPAVASVLCGFDAKEQVDGALLYETADKEQRDYASALAGAPFHSTRGQCTYCGHCKPCVADLDIAMINKYYDLATMQPEVPQSVREHYLALAHHAEECIGCHGCETRCPFEVPVAKRMEEARILFGK